jgi:glycosyltransferase involved in cell wall biosynthesis
MKVSIVTISFNQVRFVEEALRSVVEQDHDDIEYIVVDPGSTDGSRDIIERNRTRLSTVILEPDTGPADGLNKGFSAAHGEIFGFLNSDDILERGALSSVSRYFDANPDVDVISGHSWVIDADGKPLRRFYSDRYSLWMAAYGASILSQPSTFFRAEAFRGTGGFNADNRSNWDGELFVDMALAGMRFALVPEFWSRYRVHDAGITGSGKLHDLHQAHRMRMFRKIKRRELRPFDRLLGAGARYARKILNPHDTMERLRHGPVYRSTT